MCNVIEHVHCECTRTLRNIATVFAMEHWHHRWDRKLSPFPNSSFVKTCRKGGEESRPPMPHMGDNHTWANMRLQEILLGLRNRLYFLTLMHQVMVAEAGAAYLLWTDFPSMSARIILSASSRIELCPCSGMIMSSEPATSL